MTLKPHPRDNEPFIYGNLPDFGTQLTVRDYREALMCENCGHDAFDPNTGVTDEITIACEHSCCLVVKCVECGKVSAGFGPAGCPCDDGI